VVGISKERAAVEDTAAADMVGEEGDEVLNSFEPKRPE